MKRVLLTAAQSMNPAAAPHVAKNRRRNTSGGSLAARPSISLARAFDLFFAAPRPSALDRLAPPRARSRLLIFVAVSLASISWSFGAQAGSIVVPGAYATTDGNVPLNRANVPASRFQQIYEAAEFSALGGPVLITGYLARPHASQSAPAAISVTDLDYWLSTTSRTVSTLSSTFALNRGADQTLVASYDAAVVYTTANLPGAGSAKEFDIVQMFSTPFRYDPAAGNLLMEVRTTGTDLISGSEFSTSACRMGASSRTRMVISNASADATTGQIQVFGEINAFLYESAADFDRDGDVDGADLAQWEAAYGLSAAGDADADGDTDGADFLVWQRQFVGGVPGLANELGIPEPTALWLALTMLGGSALARRRRV